MAGGPVRRLTPRDQQLTITVDITSDSATTTMLATKKWAEIKLNNGLFIGRDRQLYLHKQNCKYTFTKKHIRIV